MKSRRIALMTAALVRGVSQLAATGIFLTPIYLAADTTDRQGAYVEVWGQLTWIDYASGWSEVGEFINAIAPYPSNRTGATPPPTRPTDKNPDRRAKDCAEIKIQQLISNTSASLTQVMDSVPINTSPFGMTYDMAAEVFQADPETWSSIGPGGWAFFAYQPVYYRGECIYFPTNEQGGPVWLSDSRAVEYMQQHYLMPNGVPPSLGSYGATWLGVLNATGLTGLAAAFANSGAGGQLMAQSFLLQHEYAHGMAPDLTHDTIRNEQSFFKADGTPASQDGIALLNLAAISSNQPNSGTFGQELDKLKELTGINIPSACYPSDPDC